VVKSDNIKSVEIRNRKLHRDYEVNSTVEAGIVLMGPEVKSVKAGCAQINDAFVMIDRSGFLILCNAHIDEYKFGNCFNHEVCRKRKLLLHAKEIRKIRSAIERDGVSVIPSRIYVKNGLIKIEIAMCKGKKLYDKRADLKAKTVRRETERFLARN
jgi:SsrA-binding protein